MRKWDVDTATLTDRKREKISRWAKGRSDWKEGGNENDSESEFSEG